MKYNDNGEWKDVQIKVANAIQNEYGESNNDGYSQNYLNDKVVNVGTEVDSNYRVNVLKSENLIDINKITRNYYYTDTGVYLGSEGSGLTDFIEVNSSTEYIFKGISSQNSNRRINYFDSNKNWLSQDVKLTSYEDSVFTTPTNAKYVRISYYSPTMNENTIGYYKSPYYETIGVDNKECFYSNNYSSSETKIGTWIDGKPLYRKVIFLSSLSGTSSSINLGITNASVVKYDVSFLNTGQDRNKDFYVGASTYFRSFIRSNSTLEIRNTSDLTISYVYCIIEYTKTTDTAPTRNVETRNIVVDDNDDGEIVRGEET